MTQTVESLAHRLSHFSTNGGLRRKARISQLSELLMDLTSHLGRFGHLQVAIDHGERDAAFLDAGVDGQERLIGGRYE